MVRPKSDPKTLRTEKITVRFTKQEMKALRKAKIIQPLLCFNDVCREALLRRAEEIALRRAEID